MAPQEGNILRNDQYREKEQGFLLFLSVLTFKSGRRTVKVSNIYGYVRVSSREQNEDRQIIALQELSISEKTYILTNSQEKILIDLNIKDCFAG